MLDFDHPPPSSVQPPGLGCRPPSGGHYLSSRTPISGHVRFRLPPSSEGEFLTPTHPRVQVSRSQLVSDLQNRPTIPSTPTQLSMVMNLVPRALICYVIPVVPQPPGTHPHPRQGWSLPMPASPLPTQCTLLPACPKPQVKVTTTSTPPYSWCPPAICWGPARHLPHHTHFSFGRGGGGARVAQVYPEPQGSAP